MIVNETTVADPEKVRRYVEACTAEGRLSRLSAVLKAARAVRGNDYDASSLADLDAALDKCVADG